MAQQWAWKDDCISDNAVHPIAGKPSTGLFIDWSKIMIINKEEKVLMGKVERGAFVGLDITWRIYGQGEHPSRDVFGRHLKKWASSLKQVMMPRYFAKNFFNEEFLSFPLPT